MRFLYIIALFLLTYSNHNDKVELVQYNSSECDDNFYFENLYKLNNRILSISKSKNIHTFNLFVVTNCNLTQEGKIEFKNDTLNLNSHPERTNIITKEKKDDSGQIIIIEEWTEIEEDCDCAFNLTYKIKGLNNNKHIIVFNGKEITKSNHKYKITKKKPSFSIIKNDTLNYVDIYGLKQGLHINKYKKGKLITKIEYVNNEKINGLITSFKKFESFDKIETYMKNKKHVIKKYYKSSKLIKTCNIEHPFDEGINCIYEN